MSGRQKVEENKELNEVWRIWLHPRRTSREIRELRDALSELREKISRGEEARIALQSSLSAAEQSVRCAEVENAGMQTKIEELNRQVKEYEEESAEWSRIEEEMLEVYGKLESVEQLKRDYERKIERLRLRLRDEMSDSTNDEKSELIDMQTDAPPTRARGSQTPQPKTGKVQPGDEERPEESTSPWLRVLPSDL